MAKTLDAAGVKRLIQEIKGANKNLNAPIPISTENTTESMAQNVKNIADYVEKAKAAGIANVNGMVVSCIIDDDYSGVGYLYSYNGGPILVTGIITYDDTAASPIAFFVDSEGLYNNREVVIKDLSNQVTSDMLVEGARKPIIITGDMTEVDEETYQKLLSDDVDVIANFGEGIFIESQAKVNMGDTLDLIFGYSQFDESNGAITTFTISINTSAPHTLTLAVMGLCEPVSKSTLSPVLQEIDLTGTDAERKAKLDKFETDWKALTGASDLTGARFVGKFGITDDVERIVNGIMTYCAGDGPLEKNDNCFYGICNGYSFGKRKSQIAVKVSCKNGSLTITPLFSHLEAITIKTGNTPEGKAANVAAIKAYVDNLNLLGVDTTKGYMIPICFANTELGYVMYHPFSTGSEYTGIVTGPGGASSNIAIEKNGYAYITTHIQPVESSSLTTTAKSIVPAINEVNALAKGYSTIFTPIELTTETAQNKTAIDARVAAFTAQGISLTNGCCIPVTYKGVYAGNISLINGDWYGLLVKNTNNPADNINIKLSADGTITEGNSAQ